MSKPKGSIDILKGYVMVPDEHQWALYKHNTTNKRDGTDGTDWKTIGYYSTLAHVFQKVIDSEDKGCSSIEEIVRKLEELQKYFKSKLEVEL